MITNDGDVPSGLAAWPSGVCIDADGSRQLTGEFGNGPRLTLLKVVFATPFTGSEHGCEALDHGRASDRSG